MPRSSTPAVLALLALACAALAGGAVVHASDEAEAEPETAAEAPAAEGPVEHRIDGDTEAPAEPPGVDGVAVEAVVEEPAAVHQPPDSSSEPSGGFEHETPVPRPGGPESAAAGGTGEGPVSWWLGAPEAAPQPPDSIVGVAVEALVSEPPVNYVAPPASYVPAGLAPTEMPTPKRPRPRAMAIVEAGAGAATSGSEGAAIGDGTSGGAGSIQRGGPTTPPFLSTFGSLAFDDNSANIGGLFIPPDPIGAAGPDHVVSVTNVSIQFHTKTGTPLLDAVPGPPVTGVSLAAFFAPLTPANPTFDPKVIYDQHAGRFVVVTLERLDVVLGDGMDSSRILVAVSDDSDPTGTWFMTAIPATLTFFNSTLAASVAHWADYPGFAVDEEAVYITNNMFSFLTTGGAFGGTRLWVIDKTAGAGGGFYGGGTPTVSLFDPYGASPDCLTMAPFCGISQPAHVFGAPATTPNVGTWFSFFSGLTAFGSEFMQVMRLDDPIGPGTPTFLGPSFVSMGNIDDLGGAPLPDAPQMGTAETIETNDRRTLHSVWRDDSLYVTTTIDPETGDPDDGEATAHWVHMGTSVLAGSPPPVALIDQGGIGGEDIAADTHTFFPSIAVTSNGDVAIGFSASASTIFASSAFTTRAAADPPGSNRGSVILSAGLGPYIRTLDAPACATPPAENRWGDYSGAALDPVDECFWIYNEHADTTGTPTTGGCNGRPDPEEGRWNTSFGRSCVCAESFTLTTGVWKQISMTCDQTAGNRTLGDVFGDDLAGTYETDWIVKERDAVNGGNVTLALTDPMEIGKGYWILTTPTAGTLVDNQGIDNVETEAPLASATTDGTGCGSSAGLCNLAGNPHKFSVCWSDVEVIDGASSLSLAMADPGGACQGADAAANGCVMSRIAYKWTGAAYAPFDGITPMMEGTLVPWDGFWVSGVKSGVKLKVPAMPGTCGPPAFGEGGAGEFQGGGWGIRLIVAANGLEDRANVLGQLAHSVDGYDAHDLLELAPLDPHLTVVFPHPEWGDRAGDYTSDYHLLRSGSGPDAWSFEVRSSDPAATVTLSWQGPEAQLLRSVLTDVETGEQVAVAPDGSYTFAMTGLSRSFQWSIPAGADLIFADSFESGDTSAW